MPEIEQTLSAGASAHAIMLASAALGFAAMWKTGSAAYDTQVKTGLGLEAGDAIVGFLYLGTDSGERAHGARRATGASWCASSAPRCDEPCVRGRPRRAARGAAQRDLRRAVRARAGAAL